MTKKEINLYECIWFKPYIFETDRIIVKDNRIKKHFKKILKTKGNKVIVFPYFGDEFVAGKWWIILN